MDIWTREFFTLRGYPVPHRLFSSIPGPHLRCQGALSHLSRPKTFPDIAACPKVESGPGWKPLVHTYLEHKSKTLWTCLKTVFPVPAYTMVGMGFRSIRRARSVNRGWDHELWGLTACAGIQMPRFLPACRLEQLTSSLWALVNSSWKWEWL